MMKRPLNKASAFFAAICFLASAALLITGIARDANARASVDYPIVKLRSLDKITARTQVFEASVGRTIKFGSIYIKVQACRKAPELEQPESAAFLQVWETPPAKEEEKEEKAEWIFSGWMFASSPGLSAMDHPIYDVWVLDCLKSEAQRKAEEEAAAQAAREGEGVLDADEAPAQPAIEAQ
jgi:hypothetical protein